MPNLFNCKNNYINKKGCKHKSLPPKQNNTKKKSFKNYKNNTIKSLNEVECFLRNFNDFSKYIKLYKILK